MKLGWIRMKLGWIRMKLGWIRMKLGEMRFAGRRVIPTGFRKYFHLI
jgi:hypothetical protein